MKRAAIVIGLFAVAGVVAGLLWPSSDSTSPGSSPVVSATTPRSSTASSDRLTRARRPTDRPVIEIEKGPVSDDPRDADYDPVKLAHLGTSSTDIFEGEPRDPVWAPAMEARVLERLQHDLALVQPTAYPASVECRTSSCRIIIEASEDLTESTQFALQILGNADVHSIVDAERADDGSVRQTLDALYGPNHRDLDDNAAHYRNVRESVFRQARELGDEFTMVLPADPETERSR